MSEEPALHFKELSGEDPARARFIEVTPIFRVDSVPVSTEYYVKNLGFQLAWDWGAPPTFACVTRGEVRLFLCEGDQGAPGMWLSIGVDDVDLLYSEYRKSGAKIVQPPTNFPWGRREMNVEDLDGHRIRFGSDPIEGAAHGVPLPESGQDLD